MYRAVFRLSGLPGALPNLHAEQIGIGRYYESSIRDSMVIPNNTMGRETKMKEPWKLTDVELGLGSSRGVRDLPTRYLGKSLTLAILAFKGPKITSRAYHPSSDSSTPAYLSLRLACLLKLMATSDSHFPPNHTHTSGGSNFLDCELN